MPTEDFGAEVLAALNAAFKTAGVRWYLFGAQAAAVWGEPRATADVDVTAEIPSEGISHLLASLEAQGFVPRIPLDDDFLRRARVIPIVFPKTNEPVDVVLAGSGFESSCLDRARMVDVAGVRVPVMTPEDVVIAKTLAGRPKDIEDIRGILRHQKSIDVARIEEVLRLLEEALSRSDLVSAFERLRRGSGVGK